MIFYAAFTVLLLSAAVIQGDDAEHERECKYWHTLARNLSTAMSTGASDMVDMNCNSTCNSIECSGHFQQPALLGSIDIVFCFGLRLNHCASPVSLSYYMDAPAQQIHHVGNVSHNDTFHFPGPKIMNEDSTVIVLFEMVTVNSSYVLFGIQGSLELDILGNKRIAHTETIFPPTLIDVPACETHAGNLSDFNIPGKCTAMPEPEKPKIDIKSKTYKKPCEMGLLSETQCSQNEECASLNSHSRNGMCACETDAFLSDKTGMCELKNPPQPPRSPVPTAAPTPTLVPPITSTTEPAAPSVTVANKSKADKDTSRISTKSMIIGSVAGGLLLIVAVVCVIIYIGRRKRLAVYRDRHQLLTDDDDDLNVVI